MVERYKLGAFPEPVPAAQLDRLREVEPATVGHWRHWGFVSGGVARLRRGPPVVGTAVTLAIPGEDSTLLHHLIAGVRPGDFVVIDRLGDSRYACWGGGVAVAAKAAGVVGAAVDGPCTDIGELEELDFHVWCRGLSPVTTRLRDLGGAMNVPVSCGGAVVQPGDAVLADDNGLLVIPPDELDAVIEAALDRQSRGAERNAKIQAGARLGALSGASAMVERR
ncbi:MAG: RraA family protein [Azospirillaceae bacterium]